MKDKNWMKIVGVLIGAAGFGVELLANWLSNKETEEMVDEKIRLALAEHDKTEEV